MNPDGIEDLVARWQQHRCERAIAKLLSHYRQLLSASAHRLATTWGVDMDDARQMGTLGFVHAVERYDPALGASLATYASYWIRQRMRSLVSQRGAISLPINSPTDIGVLNRATSELKAKGVNPSNEALAQRLVWTAGRVASVNSMRSAPVSFETPLRSGEKTTLGDVLPDLESQRPDHAAEVASDGRAAGAALARAMAGLRERERQILVARLAEGKTLEELAAVYGVTRERVRQIEAKALQVVRSRLQGDPTVAALGINADAPMRRSVGHFGQA